MTDRISPAARSSNMARIRSTDTGPERRVRCALHAAGFRFRLHRRDLPGTPDLLPNSVRLPYERLPCGGRAIRDQAEIVQAFSNAVLHRVPEQFSRLQEHPS
jgi:hypothetical protein